MTYLLSSPWVKNTIVLGSQSPSGNPTSLLLLQAPHYFCSYIDFPTFSGSCHFWMHALASVGTVGSACLNAYYDWEGQECQGVRTFSCEVIRSLISTHEGPTCAPNVPVAQWNHNFPPVLWVILRWAQGSVLLTSLPLWQLTSFSPFQLYSPNGKRYHSF